MGPRRLFERRGWELLAVAAIAAAVSWQLLAPPSIGMADNGDFPRVMSRHNIGYITSKFEERYFNYFVSTYRIDPRDYWESYFPSSQTFLVEAALPLNRLISRPGFFDLRSLAAIHLALELGAAWLIFVYAPVERRLSRFLMLGVATLALSDVGYVAYFNSFFSEPGSFVFLLLTLGAILATIRRADLPALLGFCAASLLFITSKPQNVTAGIVLALYCLRFCTLRRGAVWKAACAGVALCLVWASALYYKAKPAGVITYPSYFLSVFYAALPGSATPGQDLAELGLDPELAKYIGSAPWDPGAPKNDPAFERAFYDRMSFPKLILFHARHPIRFIGLLNKSAGYAPELRPDLGNYEKSAGRPPRARSETFCLWSEARKRWSPGAAWSIALFFALNGAAIIALHRRKGDPRERLLIELQLALIAMAALQWVTVTVAQGTYEATKHLFLFDSLVDTSFTLGVVWASTIVAFE